MAAPHPAPDPVISVLVAVYGAFGALETAVTALVENTHLPYELVLVDNASPTTRTMQARGGSPGADGDADGDLNGSDRSCRERNEPAAGLDEIRSVVQGCLSQATNPPPVTFLHNRRNLGFGTAMNQAALHSRGRYLCLLNSDAFVTPGWVAPLVERMDNQQSVGAVVPMLLDEEGRLEEAGVLLSRDGRTQDFGHGDMPDKPEYGFSRVVDYGSAACMLVRRCDFLRTGGFDPAFGLGYCEDVDLCLRLSAAGLSTVYEPRSKVLHLRGASSDPVSAAALIAQNTALLRERWAALLRARPEVAGPGLPPHRRFHGRDAMTTDQILLLAERMGAAARSGWWIALANDLVRSSRSRVTLAVLEGPLPPAVESQLQIAGVEAVSGVEHWDEWFANRRLLYSTVVLDSRIAGAGQALLDRYEPGTQTVLAILGDVEVDDEGWRRADRVVCNAEAVALEARRRGLAAYPFVPGTPGGTGDQVAAMLAGWGSLPTPNRLSIC